LLRKSKEGKSWVDLMMMERVGDRWEKMEGSCSTGQSPQRAVVPVEEEEEDLCFMTTFIKLFDEISSNVEVLL
jgi:hypothetical protein